MFGTIHARAQRAIRSLPTWYPLAGPGTSTSRVSRHEATMANYSPGMLKLSKAMTRITSPGMTRPESAVTRILSIRKDTQC